VTEKIHQRSRQRDDDLMAMQLQAKQLEATRTALLEEVNYLSNRNAELEDRSASLPGVQAEREAQDRRVELLLVLLGEKEEELECTVADMKEVKHMYRTQLDELIERVSGTGAISATLAAAASASSQAAVSLSTPSTDTQGDVSKS
jgi:chromosome segregation ATPase